MLMFAPDIVEDELLYSYLGRCFLLSGYATREAFMRAVVGADCRLLTPAAYGTIDIKVRYGTVISREKLLMHHTLFPFHRPYLPDGVRESIMNTNGVSVNCARWIDYSDLTPKSLRYCPECARLHMEKYGFAVWTRAHNLPHVTACHVHGINLLHQRNVQISTYPEAFVYPDMDCDNKCVPAKEEQVRYARKAAQFLEIGMSVPANPVMLRKFQRECLLKTVGGKVVYIDDAGKILSALLDRLHAMECGFNELISVGRMETRAWKVLLTEKRVKHEAVLGVVMAQMFCDDLEAKEFFQRASLRRFAPEMTTPVLDNIEARNLQSAFDFG